MSNYFYWLTFALMMIGLYTVISHGNLMKKLIGLNIFQASVFMLYIGLGKLDGGTAPILKDTTNVSPDEYSHPLPHVLILTAIVVGVATTALGLALVVRIYEAYGSLEEDEIAEQDRIPPGADTEGAAR